MFRPRNPAGFTNLTRAYGKLTTVAGNGYGGVDGVNYWQSGFEGGTPPTRRCPDPTSP